jgi:hypothetical protein
MSESKWGLCKDCKWWQIEPDSHVANTTMGLCIDEKLQSFRLRVSGNSGCNRFMEGTPARLKGSGAAPPTAQPTR